MKTLFLSSGKACGLLCLIMVAMTGEVRAQTLSSWRGTSGAVWNTTTAADWSGSIPSVSGGIRATFDGTTGLETTISIAAAGVTSDGINFSASTTPAYTFTGGTLTLDNGTTTGTIIADSTVNTETFDQMVAINASAASALASLTISGTSGGTLVFGGGLTLGNYVQLTTSLNNETVTLDGAFVDNNIGASTLATLSGTGDILNWNATSVSSSPSVNIDVSNLGAGSITNLYTDSGNKVVFGGGSGVGGTIDLLTSGMTITSELSGGSAASSTQVLEAGVGGTNGSTSSVAVTWSGIGTGAVLLPTGTSDIFQFEALADNALTISSAITTGSSTLQVQKTGVGTVVFGGVNTYTAASTAVIAGTLVVADGGGGDPLGGASANVSVSAGAGLDYSPTANGLLNIGGTLAVTGGVGTTLGGAIGSSATGSEIDVAGAATTSGAVAVNIYGISGISPSTGTYTLVAAASGLNGATYSLGNVYNASNFTVNSGSLSDSATAITVGITAATTPATEYWEGGYSGGSSVWSISNGSTSSNWSTTSSSDVATSLTPGAATTVEFTGLNAGNNATSTTLGDNMSVAGIVVSDPSGLGLNGDGFTLTIGSGGVLVSSGAGAVTLGATIAAGTETWTNNSSNALTLTGQVQINSGTLTLAGSGNTVFSGELYTTNGTLIDASGAGAVTLGGVYTNNTAFTFNNSSSNLATISGEVETRNGTFTLTGAGNTLVSGVIMGTSALTKTGAGTVTLTAANEYTQTTTVSAGKLLANNTIGSATGTGSVTVASGATLGGSGIINPTGTSKVTISSGGILAPGTSGNTNTLTISAAGNTNTSAILALASTSSGTALDFTLSSGNTASSLSLTSAIANEVTGLSGNTFNFTNVSGGALSTGLYTLILTDMATTGSSPFSGLTLAQGVALTGFTLTGLTGYTDQLELNSVGGDYALQLDIIAAVPEPGTWALLLGGLALLILAHCRRVRCC